LRCNLVASPGVAGWEWDPSLYAGSAAYYARGRLPYPRELADAIREALQLDGRGRLLDVGCGPGSLTHLLAPLVEDAVGIDADADMVRAAEAGAELVRSYLGAMPRAGRGLLPEGTPSNEDAVFTEAGLSGPVRVEVSGDRVLHRDEDDIVASVFSLSSAAPQLFGERLAERKASSTGQFSERAGPISLRIWCS